MLKFSRQVNHVRLYKLAMLSALSLILAMVLAACGGGGSPTAAPTPVPPDPTTIAQKSADALTAQNSLHYTVTIKQGTVQIIPSVDFSSADGDYLKPNKFNGNLKVKVLGGLVDAQTVGIGSQEWIIIPKLKPVWSLLPQGTGFDPSVLFDPQKGLGATVQKAKDLKLVGSETIDGVDSWHLQGTVSGPDIKTLIPIGLGQNDVTFDLWTGKQDFLTRQVTLKEITTNNNGSNWLLQFSKFNESVTINAPVTPAA